MSVAAHTPVQTSLMAQRPLPAASGALAMQAVETRMILIVGANVRLMEWAALSLFRAGHIPVLGQWFWPLVTSDTASVNSAFDDLADPVGRRLIGRCDAILCLEGPTPAANALLTTARARGLRVYVNLDDAIAG